MTIKFPFLFVNTGVEDSKSTDERFLEKPAKNSAPKKIETEPKARIDILPTYQKFNLDYPLQAERLTRPQVVLGNYGFHGHNVSQLVYQASQLNIPQKPQATWFDTVTTLVSNLKWIRGEITYIPVSNRIVGRPDLNKDRKAGAKRHPESAKVDDPNFPIYTITVPDKTYGYTYFEALPPQDGEGPAQIEQITVYFMGEPVTYRGRGKGRGFKIGCFDITDGIPAELDFSQPMSEVVRSVGKGETPPKKCPKPGSLERPGPEERASHPKGRGLMFKFITAGPAFRGLLAALSKKPIAYEFWLWNFLHTSPFCFPKSHYEKFGVNFGEIPGDGKDLGDFFKVMGDSNREKECPLYNANYTYVSQEDGQIYEKPTDLEELKKLNEKERLSRGLSEITPHAHVVLNWMGISENLDDPEEYDWLPLTPEELRPGLRPRLQLLPNTVLPTPLGNIFLKDNYQISLDYKMTTADVIENGQTITRPKIEVAVKIEKPVLGETSLSFLDQKIEIKNFTDENGQTIAAKLEAEEITLNLSLIRTQKGDETSPSWHFEDKDFDFQIKDIKAQGFKASNEQGTLNFGFENGEVLSFSMKGSEQGLVTSFEGLKGEQLALGHPLGQLVVDQGNIPQVEINYNKKLNSVSVRAPLIKSSGSLEMDLEQESNQRENAQKDPLKKPSKQASLGSAIFGQMFATNTKVHGAENSTKQTQMSLKGKGESEIKDFYLKVRDKTRYTETLLSFGVAGEIEETKLENTPVGTLSMTTVDPKAQESKTQYGLEGKFRALLKAPLQKGQESKLTYHATLTHFDYLGYHVEDSPIGIKMQAGKSWFRQGQAEISSDKMMVRAEEMNLELDEMKGFDAGFFKIGNFRNVRASGGGQVDLSPSEFVLGKIPGSTKPLKVSLEFNDLYYGFYNHFLNFNLSLNHAKANFEIHQIKYSQGNQQHAEAQIYPNLDKVKLYDFAGWSNLQLSDNLTGFIDYPISLPLPYQSGPVKGRDHRQRMNRLFYHVDSQERDEFCDKESNTCSDAVRVGRVSSEPEQGFKVQDLIVYTQRGNNYFAFGLPEIQLDNQGNPIIQLSTLSPQVYYDFNVRVNRGGNLKLKSPRSQYTPPQLPAREVISPKESTLFNLDYEEILRSANYFIK